MFVKTYFGIIHEFILFGSTSTGNDSWRLNAQEGIAHKSIRIGSFAGMPHICRAMLSLSEHKLAALIIEPTLYLGGGFNFETCLNTLISHIWYLPQIYSVDESTSWKPRNEMEGKAKICFRYAMLLPALMTCLFYKLCDPMGNLLIPWVPSIWDIPTVTSRNLKLTLLLGLESTTRTISWNKKCQVLEDLPSPRLLSLCSFWKGPCSEAMFGIFKEGKALLEGRRWLKT